MREYRVRFSDAGNGWIMATVPEMPAAITQGRDMEEARLMIRDAIKLLLECYADDEAADTDATWETITIE
jgi:predicted RNase H-like HicB family nuclease